MNVKYKRYDTAVNLMLAYCLYIISGTHAGLDHILRRIIKYSADLFLYNTFIQHKYMKTVRKANNRQKKNTTSRAAIIIDTVVIIYIVIIKKKFSNYQNIYVSLT